MTRASRLARRLGWLWGDAPEMTSSVPGLVWLLFLFTCLQLIFLKPYLVLIPGQRVNLFSGLLCALTLMGALGLKRKFEAKSATGEALFTIALSALAVLSALCGLSPINSLLRVFVFLASAAGGFWSARLLLSSRPREAAFRGVILAASSGLIILLLSQYLLRNVASPSPETRHTSTSLIFLLSLAPLSWLCLNGRARRLVGGLMLGLGFAVFFLSLIKSALLICGGLAVTASLVRALSWRRLLVVLVVVAASLAYMVTHAAQSKVAQDFDSALYRLENYSFSWHIAQKHPWLGIGPWAPRDQPLSDYHVKHPHFTREGFRAAVSRGVTSENMYLTMMVDLGFPFLILYLTAVLILFVRLVAAALKPPSGVVFPPLAILLPLTAGLAHFLVFDGLYHPQVSWYFHLLLGLTPGLSSGE